MPDPDMVDKTYITPMAPKLVEKVLEKESPLISALELDKVSTQTRIIADTLDRYCKASGQKVKVQKSDATMFSKYSKLVQETLKNPYMLQNRQIPGGALRKKQVIEGSANDLIEKFKMKMQHWKTKTLSRAGRITMIKAVMAAILNELISFTKGPQQAGKIKMECRMIQWRGPDHPWIKSNFDGSVHTQRNAAIGCVLCDCTGNLKKMLHGNWESRQLSGGKAKLFGKESNWLWNRTSNTRGRRRILLNVLQGKEKHRGGYEGL
ncbi:hypothetical protein HHK36_018941 [Tetracentron sinense]|uniref:Uncharacterized protein n=1 Tax=Tetracentron sinense TaxID=13715 RepID=A0A834Z1B5_TETSI|nr:hypothetical protein HHK36_018941 [Tetracentron sinense]